jgi:RNA polymerase sigma factor (sigma-70 family)
VANPTDEELMERVRNGDPDSLGILFDRYQARLHGFLLRYLGDAATAEELVGEVFWRVWERRKQFRSRFSGWLFAIARTAALDDLRKPYRRERFHDDLNSEEGEFGEPSRSYTAADRRGDWVHEMTLRDQIREALLKLPEDQRAAFLLREYEGCGYAEVAEALGCTVGNARLLAHRARLALRSLLLPLLMDEEDPCPRR